MYNVESTYYVFDINIHNSFKHWFSPMESFLTMYSCQFGKIMLLCIYDLCPKLSTDFYWVVNVTDRLLCSLFFPWLFYCIVSIFLSLLLYWAGVFCLSRLGPICKKCSPHSWLDNYIFLVFEISFLKRNKKEWITVPSVLSTFFDWLKIF